MMVCGPSRQCRAAALASGAAALATGVFTDRRLRLAPPPPAACCAHSPPPPPPLPFSPISRCVARCPAQPSPFAMPLLPPPPSPSRCADDGRRPVAAPAAATSRQRDPRHSRAPSPTVLAFVVYSLRTSSSIDRSIDTRTSHSMPCMATSLLHITLPCATAPSAVDSDLLARQMLLIQARSPNWTGQNDFRGTLWDGEFNADQANNG